MGAKQMYTAFFLVLGIRNFAVPHWTFTWATDIILFARHRGVYIRLYHILLYYWTEICYGKVTTWGCWSILWVRLPATSQRSVGPDLPIISHKSLSEQGQAYVAKEFHDQSPWLSAFSALQSQLELILLEIASAITSIFAIAALIAILCVYNGHAAPSWLYGITVSNFISFILRATILLNDSSMRSYLS